MAIQLGVSMCSGGGAALYNTSTRALIALAEEAPGDGARAARRYAGPALPPRAARERPAAQEEGPPLAPKGAIRACLEAAGLSWGDVGAVRVSGPEGAVERLWVELLGLSPERVTAGPSPQLALARYAAALDGAPGDALIIATDPHGPHGEHGDRGARRAYSLYHARAGELHLTHERLLSPHLAPLSCPAQAYLALAERARLTLGAPLGAGELLGWASNLAAEGEELPNLPPWFSARRGALDAEARPYDLWLDVLALERRLERLSAGLGASEGQRRALWASLLRKGQRELAAALGEVARGARASLGVATLTLAGALASDPRLCDLVGAHSAPEGAGGAARAYPGGGAAVAAAAAGLGERRGEREAPLEVPLALAGRRGREGGAREGGARLEAQAAALDVASRLLSVKELEPSELERQFAQLIARGEGVGRYEPSSPLATPLAAPLAAPQATSRALLLSPTCAAARSRLNEELAGRPLHAPLYIICPAERAAQLFDPPPRAPLALAAPRPEHLEALRPALRADGLAQVVAVSPDEDPALVRLCEALWAHFHHPPALLAAPLALRSGQPVDSPAEAARWLLGGGAGALISGRRWVTRRAEGARAPRGGAAQTLAERLAVRRPAIAPSQSFFDGQGGGQGGAVSAVSAPLWAEVEALDALIFDAEEVSDEWEDAALEELSRHLAPHRGGSARFGEHPLHPRFEAALGGGVTLLLNPRGLSRLLDDAGRWPPRLYAWPETLALAQLLCDEDGRFERLSRPLGAPPREAARLAAWALAELEAAGLRAHPAWRAPPPPPAALVEVRGGALLAPFQDPLFSLQGPLGLLWARLRDVGYGEGLLAPLRGDALPAPLPGGAAGALARLFWRGEELPRAAALDALGEPLCALLTQLGVLWGGDLLHARLALDCVAGAYVASDFAHGARGRLEPERPCPPLTPLARGAVRLGLSRRGGRALDASDTYGAAAVSLARSAERLVAVARDERALRFTRFNLQLNGVERCEVVLGEGEEAPRGPFHTLLSAHEGVAGRLGALLTREGRACMWAEDLARLEEAAVPPPGRGLTLPLVGEGGVPLDDPRLSQGFGAVAGYWLFEASSAAREEARPMRLHRPLCALPGEGTHRFVDHFFAVADLAARPRERALCAPHPALLLSKRSGARGQVAWAATHARWAALAPIGLSDEVYAQLKSLVSQRQSVPLTPTGAALTLLGLKVLKGAERA